MDKSFIYKVVITILGVGCLVVSKLILEGGSESDALLVATGGMFGWAWTPRPGDTRVGRRG